MRAAVLAVLLVSLASGPGVVPDACAQTSPTEREQAVERRPREERAQQKPPAPPAPPALAATAATPSPQLDAALRSAPIEVLPARSGGGRGWVWLAGGGLLVAAAVIAGVLLLPTDPERVSCPTCTLPSMRVGR
jgi:hypothetical protein